MHNIKDWRKSLEDINKQLADLQSLIKGNELDSLHDPLSRLKTLASKISSDIDENIKRIKEADREKGLFSDRRTKVDLVQLPIFSGTNNDNFMTFQEKFKKCCITNQIPKSDQLEKLREVLKGNAKKLVPERTETMERAWDLLKAAYGDPMILLRHRKENLLKLGEYPDDQAKTNPQKIVEWFLAFKGLADELIKVGGQDDCLEMEVFNDSTVNAIVDLFPARLLFKMETSGQKKLEDIIRLCRRSPVE